MTLSEPALLPAQRRERLLADLRTHGTLRVSEIARALGVTTVTVRRDLAQLADEGAIERVHGGIRLPRGADTPPPLPAAVEDPGRPAGGDEATRPAVGMVVPSLDYYWPEIIRGARDAAPDAGVRVVLRGSSYDDVADVRRQASWLLETVGVEGLLIAPPTVGDEAAALISWLAGLAVPVVFVERTATVGPYQEHVESVSTDHAFGASLAVRHLAAEGHRRVGFLASASSPTTAAVRRGWRRTCTDLGLDLDGTPEVISSDHREPGWGDDVDRAIDACAATATTALLVHSDREAISLIARCEERGIRIPRDLAVVAYDDEVAGLANPALSAIRPAKYTIGETAMELLSKRIQGGADRPVHRVRISPQLIVRDTSRVPGPR
ncbi:LacI family transcriptional regulator [Catellatospora sp. TT07R-123]|uniref:substrate-binding domain-containing protein n=1 Tax=Catellatospora sp. TT07R-123 TaxID=2733863 RepID=UPI001B03F14F|nr:substrate-binding domain-containing protein [Catellatospora sp. TT07R-123]GHJ43633.1 LacI family transcriptional regulator [Catellatospora sp. TT07R-123]